MKTQINPSGMPNGFSSELLHNLDMDEQNLIKRRMNVLGSSYKLMYHHPVEFVRGDGMYLYDAAGVPYLDCYNNVVSVGHCNARVAEAVARQISTLNTHTRYLHPAILDYAERLLATFPAPLKRVMFACTGSEAVDLALRIAFSHTGADGVIISEFAYHGTTMTASSVSPSLGQSVPLGQHVRTVRAPLAYREEVADVGLRLARDVEEAIDDLERHGIRFAAFLADSIFSSDGLASDPAGFLQPVIEVVHRRGGLYIADEVQPGFCRTGDAFWGFQRHHIVPDIVVMGKPMGNGMPISACVTAPDFLEQFSQCRYFNTFDGNPVSIAAAAAVLSELQERDLLKNCRTVGALLKGKLQVLQKKYDCIGDIRGTGLYWSIEFVKDQKTKEPDAALTLAAVNALREAHILVSTFGLYENCMKLRPLLIMEPQHVDQFADSLDCVLERLTVQQHAVY
ncbi:aspartate aminotransferase family protein [Megasphaera cerevisiae]|uniref:aspartate aminotransferase family protein n=1 Tax=Megasphaera cerevisiae TaxID=39029 RepID=UPI000B29C99A|nr:aspartate aminotransferase family protein [Megasphaera cerevisiae]